MRREAIHYAKYMAQRWILSLAVLFVSNANALGLGEIQLSSNLGEPLKAQVALFELADADAQDMRVRLASADEYKKNSLQYPDGIKFKLQVVNEQGSNPFIRITTLRPVDEPFLDLLVEVSSPSGKIIKAYTFLIDPAPDLVSFPVVAQPAANIQQAGQAKPKEVSAESVIAIGPEGGVKPDIIEKPVVRSAKRKKRMSLTGSSSADSKASEDAGNRHKTRQFGKLSLSLSTSLSISKNSPGLPGNPIESNDALQEELIAKEKMLGELNAQIAEMQGVIKMLQSKLGIQPGSAVAAAGVVAQSAVANVIPESAVIKAEPIKQKIPVPAITPPLVEPGNSYGLLNHHWPKAAAGLVLLLLGVGGIFWYRKCKLEDEWAPGAFENLGDSEDVTGQEKSDDLTGAKLKIGEQSMKVPAYKEQKREFTSPPEYDLLEEADIYLRFGHDKLAEEVLREAIRINPSNPHSYLTLLGIYDTRGDVKEFSALAQQLKAMGDDVGWKKAVEMGRKLDPGNPLYA